MLTPYENFYKLWPTVEKCLWYKRGHDDDVVSLISKICVQ